MDCVPFLPKEVALGKTRSFPQNWPESARLAGPDETLPKRNAKLASVSGTPCRDSKSIRLEMSGPGCPSSDLGLFIVGGEALVKVEDE